MDEEFKRRIHKIKKMNESIKRRTKIYSALGNLDDRGTARALGSLQRAPSPGKKIQKIGFILFLSPEPFTTVAGVPMIIAGKYLNKVYNGSTIADIGHETKNFARSISDIKDKMR
jgi:Icc-related predicted phosphoesterase